MTLKRQRVSELLKETPGKEVLAKGWVRTKRGNKNKGLGKNQKGQQEHSVHRAQRRLYYQQHTDCLRFLQLHAGRDIQGHHHRLGHSRDRKTGRIGRQRSESGNTSRENRAVRNSRPGEIPSSEKRTQHGVPARDCPSAPTHQHFRSRTQNPSRHGVCHSQIFQ